MAKKLSRLDIDSIEADRAGLSYGQYIGKKYEKASWRRIEAYKKAHGINEVKKERAKDE